MKVLLATCRDYPTLYGDEALLKDELLELGIDAEAFVWNQQPLSEAAGAARCLLRSTWDYHHHEPAFRRWLGEMDALVGVTNPLPLVLWNLHKGYLLDLANRGIPVVPTQFWQRQGGRIDELAALAGWGEIIIKPAVAAGAHGAARFPGADHPQARSHLATLLESRDALVQPYLPSVETSGERSLVFIDGQLTHAIRRPPALREGVGIERLMELVPAEDDEVTVAAALLSTLEASPLFARVDLVRDRNGEVRLMELELIEPRLFLREHPEAAQRLARALAQRLA